MTKKKLNFVGIDVSKATLHVAFADRDDVHEFENTAKAHKALVRFLEKRGRARVVVEVTGTYGLDLALALHRTKRIELHYINPVVAKGFASTRLARGKTDRVDAHLLARLGKCLHDDLAVWEPPSEAALQLRVLTRRIYTVVCERTRELNRLSSLRSNSAVEAVIREDIKAHVTELEARIDRLRAAALEHVQAHPELVDMLELLTSVDGIGKPSALYILGEYVCLPQDLSKKQIVAQAGLDPQPRQSGTRDGPRSISKKGNKYLRAAMHMPAVNAVKYCPEIKGFYRLLVQQRKKKALVAYTAIARKLLVAIHAMLQNGTRFDPERFYQGEVPPPVNLAV